MIRDADPDQDSDADPGTARAVESFWDRREEYRLRFRAQYAPRAAEPEGGYERGAGAPSPLNERLIQAIWSNQMLRTDGLRLMDGRPVRVLEPGEWSGSAGPDFRGARLMIGGESATGDIEVHLLASDWRAHRHETDLDYNGCVLHVVLRADDGLASDRLHNGAELPRLELEPFVFPDLDTIRRSLTPDDYLYDRTGTAGRCREMMLAEDPLRIAEFLDRAGDERFVAKIRRLEEQCDAMPAGSAHSPAGAASMEQVFHQAWFMALGSGPGKSLYYLLARRAPLAELLDYAGELAPDMRRLGIEAILLKVANLVPRAEDLPADAPPESRAHLEIIEEIWSRFEPFWSDRTLAPTKRWFKGIRPVNFPTRRIGAVAAILARAMADGKRPLQDLAARAKACSHSLAEAQATKRIHRGVQDLIDGFEVETAGSFWATHYSFSAQPAPRAMALIGESTARSIVFNAVLPSLALLARRTEDAALLAAAQRVYAIFPPLQANQITSFMEKRLFGENGPGKALLTTERRLQGMFQIFYSCCNGESAHCDSCYYLSKG